MNPYNPKKLGITGMTVTDETGALWVYIGYRLTSVGTHEHHFACRDHFSFGTPWTYKAVYAKTLQKKFPDLTILERQ